MRDYDVRQGLKARLKAEYSSDPDALILEEFVLCDGVARIDIALVNGTLNGFEIKSDRDTLERLPKQSEFYSKCFDEVTLVVGERHFAKATTEIPDWWGILVATFQNGVLELRQEREARRNPSPCAQAIVKLLWKAEALSILAEQGLDKGFRNKPRRAIQSAIASLLPIEEVSAAVRLKIKARGDWKSDSRLAQGNGSSPTASTPSARQANRDWLLSGGFQRLLD